MIYQLYKKQVEAWKERAVVTLVKELNEIVFVKSTNSVTGEEEELKPYIADLEGTIQINGEFDREDLKNVLSKLSSRHKDTIELLEAEIERKRDKRLTLANKGYDGNNLESACDFYGIAAENWVEIVRYEDGFNSAINQDIAYLEENLQKIKKEI